MLRALWMADITALVVRDAETRTRLAGYFESAGFEIQKFADTPPASCTTSTIVWVIGEDEHAAAAQSIRSWLASRPHRHVVIVTRNPTPMRLALQMAESRLQILVPPVFPWQLVDAVRAAR